MTLAVGALAVPAQVPGLDTETGVGRVVVTVLLLTGLAAVWLLVEGAVDRLRERVSGLAAETTETVAFTVLVGLTTWALVVVWDAGGQITRTFETVTDESRVGADIVVSVLLVSTAYGVTRVVRRVLDRSRVVDVTTAHRRQVVYHVVQVTVYVVGGLLVLAVWGVNLGNLLLGAGVLGVVVGLAARETLGAVIAGFILLFARPFTVGDWVVIADREGTVENITIFNTRLRTVDGEQVTIPNDRVASQEVVNRTREGRLRETVEVGVDYETDVDEAIAVAERAMRETDGVLATPAPRAVGKGFGDSAVVLELRFWVGDPTADRVWRARTAVVTAVKEAFAEAGVEIPFPQRTLGTRDADRPVPPTTPPPAPDGGGGDKR